ncbi:MAG: DUF1844 domain-containing protein [Kiritimatiellae bacterium]|nr:DUF1844 domain-containing protein [Kiritimatiellia bacterium]MCO5067739.1 DUF1844 domain-containing protein [Kiritimatiellia bacterium]
MTNLNLDEQNKQLFAHLLVSLAQSALLGLGKIVHPATQKTEVDLDAAQQAIDLIDMLAAKTKGNLDGDEERMLSNTLSMLKLNYVETRNAKPSAAPQAPAADAPAAADPNPIIAPSSDDKTSPDDDKVRFRKSYG